MGMFGIEGEGTRASTDAKSSGNQNTQSNTRRLSAEDEDYVQQLLRSFSSQTNPDLAEARAKAIEDTKVSINDLFTQYSETALPQILSAANKTGGYSATATQQLSNDAFARTVSQAGALKLNAINQYETTALNRSQQALSGLSTSLQALLQANESSSVANTFNTKTSSTTNTFKLKGGLSLP